MSKVEILSRLRNLENLLPQIKEMERDAKGKPIVFASRIPLSAKINQEIKSLRVMLAEY